MARVGMFAILYRAAALLTGADPEDASGASWTEIDNVRDLTQNVETGEADVTTRSVARNGGWRQTLSTLKEGSIEFEMVWDPDDADYLAFKDAWINGEEIACAAMSGDIEDDGEDGLVSNFSVTNFSRGEPLEDAIKVNVTLKPSSQTQWYVVGESGS